MIFCMVKQELWFSFLLYNYIYIGYFAENFTNRGKGETVEPCYFSSSIYYGGQEIYSPSTQTSVNQNIVSHRCMLIKNIFKIKRYIKMYVLSLVFFPRLDQERCWRWWSKWKSFKHRFKRKLVAGYDGSRFITKRKKKGYIFLT